MTTRCDQGAVVATEGGHPRRPLMPREFVFYCPFAYLPHARGRIVASRNNKVVSMIKRNIVNRSIMRLPAAQTLAVG